MTDYFCPLINSTPLLSPPLSRDKMKSRSAKSRRRKKRYYWTAMVDIENNF